MHYRRLGLAAAALLAMAALVTATTSVASKPSAAAPTPKTGGTLTFGAEQEPPCLNGYLSGCNNTWTSWVPDAQFRGLYIIKPDFSIVPDMADGEAVVTKNPFTVTFKIRANATWSDGVPVTVADFIYTWLQNVNPKNDVASTAGWDSIKRVVTINPKTGKIIFSKPYAPWKVLLADGLFPSHALQGSDFNNVWNTNLNNPKTGKPISDGPYIMTNYTKGQSMTFAPNPKWYGPHKPYLSKLVFVFRTDTNSEIQAIKGGEVDAIYPQPQLQLADLKSDSALAIQSNSGTTLEHLDFNEQLKGGQPLLRAPWFRQALAYSVDRAALVKQLYRTLNPTLAVANNLTYSPLQKEYKPSFAMYTYNPAKVASIMTAHSCTKGGDGIWSCKVNSQTIRASVKFGTTAGNALRELAEEIMQAQAKNAGIEFVTANSPSRVFFPAVSDGNYQIALFAWVSSGDPTGQADIYGCDAGSKPRGSNWKGYCSTKVTQLLVASDSELDPAKRVLDVNGADALMAQLVPSLPLYLKPTYLVYKKTVHGMIDDPTLQGPTWNMEDWWVG